MPEGSTPRTRALFLGPDTPVYAGTARACLAADFDLVVIPATEAEISDPATLDRVLPETDFIVGWTRITADMIARAPKLKFIQVMGSGYEIVDMDAVRARGIRVGTTQGANAVSCAELAFGYILALYRKLADCTDSIRRGEWISDELRKGGLVELRGKTIGLVGFGTLGQAVATIAEGFGLDRVYHKRTPLSAAEESRWGVSYLPLDELMAASDIVCVQVPLSAATRHLIGRREIGLMKPSALLVNIARGPVVDEQALAEALIEGRVAGAGLDVFAREPVPVDSPLLRLGNVILTPHVAGSTQEALARNVRQACENVRRVAAGQDALNLAN